MKGEALGFAAVAGNNVDVRIAVVRGGVGDPFSVWRKFWIELVAGAGGQAERGAAFAGGGPQIAGVGEDNFVFGDVRVAKETRRPGRRLSGETAGGAAWRWAEE
jgi:hypothetical protein